MTVSTAARAYSRDHCTINHSALESCEVESAFDAGCAHALATVTPRTIKPEPAPVLLTDPEDPRIKPGARVRVVLEATVSADPWGELRPGWVADHINGTYKVTEGVYLIAEAPADPDEPILAALRVNGFVADQLAALRAAGYDVVKQAL